MTSRTRSTGAPGLRSRRGGNGIPALFAAACFAAAGGIAPAVVVDQLGGGNTTAPVDDPGWNNVGAIWVGGGVYLGGGWVLTAHHIGSGSGFSLGGTTYPMVAGTGHQLTNNGVAGKSAFTDLYLFQIDGRPAVPAVSIASSGATIGDTVTMIGRGRNQTTTLTQWTVNTAVSPWTWAESPPATAPNAAGYKTTSAQSKTWGKNVIDGAGWLSLGSGQPDLVALGTTFDSGATAIAGEGQVVWGDSGGGVFVKQSGKWNLAGIVIAQDAYSGQPFASAAFGNGSYFADLSFYRDQIVAITVPEPGAGVQAAIAGAAALLAAAAGRRRRGGGGRWG